MAPYAELKISKRTFKELPFLPFIAREKILKNLLVRLKQCRSTDDSLQPEGVVYTLSPSSLFLYVFSPSRDPSRVFRCLERLPRILHQFFEFDI